jgi:hypothetical protein
VPHLSGKIFFSKNPQITGGYSVKAPQKVRMLSAESQKFVAGEIHGPVNKEPQELSQILIEMKKFHQYKKGYKPVKIMYKVK